MIKILLVEDNKYDAELIWYEITKNEIDFEKLLVKDEIDYIQALDEFKPDIILSDFYMSSSFDAIKAILLRNEFSSSTPLIVVTHANSEVTAIKCMRMGANEYVLKDNLSLLTPIILNLIKYKNLKELIDLKSKKNLQRIRELTKIIIKKPDGI